ncbi:BON domain-containing protein [Leptolyngbya sp. FACHB-261]|uniref:BON domain-containing protein n=1 Tax=Leptolyngbya sp. FACHB-261 TaxID=2692806 RepID=UPI001685EC9A|nr:BON domain-containing protein [Leptolyngbya sp. FACHB-261]MBD2101412.1 BON domain-containing protein [Leptolyngbya sp. FACHB-261]
MSWLQRVLGPEQDVSLDGGKGSESDKGGQMGPGLTGQYDMNLREKAGMHQPPPPPEFMGVEGEYDPVGLAKRVAVVLDQDPEIQEISELEILQNGSTILFKGSAPDAATLERIHKAACKVDGTRVVDTSQVNVAGNVAG